MTGGTVAILGPVGENFGAGMTGGMAFIYDAEDRFDLMANADTITWRRIGSAFWDALLRDMIGEHVERTGSMLGYEMLKEWERHRAAFWQICPKEMLTRLAQPLEDQPEDTAVVAAE
jgi:glutamate synthase (NADPH/NADH) large chain